MKKNAVGYNEEPTNKNTIKYFSSIEKKAVGYIEPTTNQKQPTKADIILFVTISQRCVPKSQHY